MYEDIVPARLIALRTKKGVSARDMSLSLGQNPGYINNIETNKSLPSMASFFYICEYFEITPQEFFDTSSGDPQNIRYITDNLKKLNSDQLASISNIIEGLAK